MPQHQQLLVIGSGPHSHQRLETRLQPPPPPFGPGLPTPSPLRCHLYPPMNDSRSPWTSSRGPVRRATRPLSMNSLPSATATAWTPPSSSTRSPARTRRHGPRPDDGPDGPHHRGGAHLHLCEYWPDVQAALRGETPVSQQTSHATEAVRMVDIDDTPDEDDT